MQIKLTSFVVILFLSIIFWTCSDEQPFQPPRQTEPTLSNLSAPPVLYNASAIRHPVSVKVQDQQGREDIAEVRYVLFKTGSATILARGPLLDDGTQGDIIPKDGVFTTEIDGRFAQNDTGEFALEVVAEDVSGLLSDVASTTITVRPGEENRPPEIVQTFQPKTLPVDSSFEFILAAKVVDAEGLSDIASVQVQFFPPSHPNPTFEEPLLDDGLSGDQVAGDGIFTKQLSTELFKQASDHFFRFEARDQAGNMSQPVVVTVRGYRIGNRPPIISNVVAPDTVKINPEQDTPILITVQVADAQGLSDIDNVEFRSFLPDGTEANNSPTQLADDGDTENTGDAVAGDGTYSRIVVLPKSGVPTGDFRFEFRAEDKSGAFSNIINHILTVTN